MILGLDLSLNETGWATIDDLGGYSCGTIKPPKGLTGLPRLAYLESHFQCFLRNSQAAGLRLVVVEGYAMGIRGGRVFDIGELGGVVRLILFRRNIPTFIFPPSSLKQFVTGNGSAKKDLMLLEIFKRWGQSFSNDNIADAYALARVGVALEGRERLTEGQKKALTKAEGIVKATPDTARSRVRG